MPWLRDYVQSQMTEFLLASELDPAAILQRLRGAADAVTGAVRGGDGGSLIEAVISPAQREIMDRLTSVMTLVEGHGDYVMDAVGPQVVPSVAQIRERFSSRRGTTGRIEQTVRRMLGIDLKMKQYAEGSKFVQAGGRRSRHGHLQQGLDLPADPAHQSGVRGPAASGWNGSTTAPSGHGPQSGGGGSPQRGPDLPG